ncbi:MAG: hypothetical protein J6I85_04395 [Clostridia bacterium]|nr:hypothetical protein [Clostridia bacterium]
MKEKINFGIGFVTGRPNVCRIINNYYKNMLDQIKKYGKDVELTIFILFDTSYQSGRREEFYHIIPEVYKDINIVYITPEDIQEEIKKLVARENMNYDDMNFFLGHGHAKGRNTVMYYALKHKMDYLLFWDDDEYPVAVLDNNGKIDWQKQDNILKHLNFMDEEQADVTIGYHCGYISPIPYIDYTEDFGEQDMKEFIEVVSNDIISWESIREKMNNNNGVTFARKDLADGKGAYEIESDGVGKWVAGSTLCLKFTNNGEKIPAFYNPPLARGEDTFFSTLLGDSKIVRIPVYHFHDGFLKYTEIMEENFPKKLRKINVREENVKSRFLKATMGWIKYKPLLMYIKNKETYRKNIEETIEKLEDTVPKLNKVFFDDCFTAVLHELEKYDREVEKHYEEYLKTNRIWETLKKNMGIVK